jgi:hypothetical protein
LVVPEATVNTIEVVVVVEVFLVSLMPPIITWFQPVVVVVLRVTKAVHKLEMVEMAVQLLELQGLADSVVQLERMLRHLLEVRVEQEASQV